MLYQEFVRNASEQGWELGLREGLERHFEDFLATSERAAATSAELSDQGVSPADEAGETTPQERRTAGS